ncbi:Ca-activated chloride channel family protein [Pseudonocardia kunmingensis]|uniref:Ca-activated chloride channel family protein n=2 Tax=Pseudonocardia kunmingensis TaxID=630975 RepID=A0A543DQ72_9PSEU|nr:Ca-activated chloride channel family protein [Pseudonocardia kunmingensis]
MRFLAPGWLALLAAVAALVVAYVVVQRRRGRYAVRFAALPLLERVLPRGPGWRRHVPAVAFLVTVAGMVLALSRPVVEVQVPRERATVIVAVDVSASMGAEDVAPTRSNAAVAAARTFVDELPDTFNVGLVLFSGSTALTVPPTVDHAAVHAAFDGVTMGSGTAIGDAVLTALDGIRALDDQAATDPPPARIVLLSDGANTTGSPISAAAAAAAAAATPVSTIAFGTPEGTATVGGSTMPVPADIPALAALAADSGGQAYQAETGEELQEVYTDIGSSIGYRAEEREVTSAVLAGALLAALAAAAGSLAWFARLP